MIIFAILNFAGVVKLVDTLDLGSSASRCEGSSPFARTSFKSFRLFWGFFDFKDEPQRQFVSSKRHPARLLKISALYGGLQKM
jgi:hypothetical protein